MKKIIAALLFLLLFVDRQVYGQSDSLKFDLLQIKKDKKIVGHLVGIMHNNPIGKEPNNLSAVSKAILGSDDVITELGLHQFVDSERKANEAREIVRSHRKLADVLSKEQINLIVERLIPVLGQGVKSRIDTAHPWDIGNVLISKCAPTMNKRPTESVFIELAETHEKPVLALETIQEQFESFPPYDWEKWNSYLNEIIRFSNEPDCLVQYGNLIQRMSGTVYSNYENIQNILTESESILNTKEFDNISIISRNQRMASRIESRIKLKKIDFFAIGAMHLVGNYGVVALLKKRGYQIIRAPY